MVFGHTTKSCTRRSRLMDVLTVNIKKHVFEITSWLIFMVALVLWGGALCLTILDLPSLQVKFFRAFEFERSIWTSTISIIYLLPYFGVHLVVYLIFSFFYYKPQKIVNRCIVMIVLFPIRSLAFFILSVFYTPILVCEVLYVGFYIYKRIKGKSQAN